jgi:hypothetical protein
MRFLLGVLVGYFLRGKQKLLIRFLVTLALVVYVVIPAIALLGLSLDGDGLALLAILGTKVHLLEVGRIPNADEIYADAVKQAVMERLRRIHAAGGETETGVIIVTFQGYISGVPSLFSNDFNTAFIFKDTKQAETFIAEFTNELHNPQILDCP